MAKLQYIGYHMENGIYEVKDKDVETLLLTKQYIIPEVKKKKVELEDDINTITSKKGFPKSNK